MYDHDSATTTRLGLEDAEHTLSNGSTKNTIVATTLNGYVLGHAKRGRGGLATSNRTPWIYDPTTGLTHAAGLTEGNFTANNEERKTQARQINKKGQVVGNSQLFFQGSPSSIVRDSAWFFDPETGSTTELALDLAISTRATWMRPSKLNNRGQVAGIAANSMGRGDFVWFYDHDSETTLTGFDAHDQFTSSRFSRPEIAILDLTDSGLVLGESQRHNRSNGGDAGSTHWLFDSTTGVTHSLVFSFDSERGNAFTKVTHMSEAGVLFGEYDAYDDANQLLDRRYFYWSIEQGFHDLESLIVGDIVDEGWDSLVRSFDFSTGIAVIDEGFLAGYALRGNGNFLPFALIQVPEPSTGLLLWIVLSTLATRRLSPAA